MSRARHAAGSGDGTRRSVTLLIIVALLAGGMLLVDAAAPLTAGDGPGPLRMDRSDLAISYCPVAVGDAERASVTVAAVGEEASEVTLLRHSGEGVTEVAAEQTLQPGRRADLELGGGEPVTVHARGGEVAAVWSVDGERSATGPCVDEPSEVFYLAGLDSSLGSQASLHLFNPFTVDAVVRVRFGTTEGPSELVRTENVAVPAGQTHTLDLTELQPEEPELGVIVETVTGRVVAQGEVERTRIDDVDEGPQGRALVEAATALSAEAYFAQVSDGDEWSSRLAIFNPNDGEAAVRVHATTPDPETPVEEVSVPAGGVAAIDLAGRSQHRSFALTVRSLNEMPVLVARVEGRAGDPASIAVPVGAPAGASRWVTAGPPGDRNNVLSVYNPGDEAVRVTATVGGGPVARWRGRVLGSGARQLLDLADVEGSWPAVLEASGPIVVEVVSSLRGMEDAADGDEGDPEDAEDGDVGDPEEAEGEDADEGVVADLPEIRDLGRLVGLTRPAEPGDPMVSVPRVRSDPAVRLTPVEDPDEQD